MTHWSERLSEFLDGELSPEEQRACEAHLAECGACRELLAELQLVVTAARSDADRDPATDLWPGILERIGGRAASGAGNLAAFPKASDRALARPRQITFSLPQLALAASLLMAVTAGVSYLATVKNVPSTVAQGPAPLEAPIQAMSEDRQAAPSGQVVPANFADEQFDRAISDLEQTLIAEREHLDPRTVVVIERNLAVIDEAIRQARAALDADPANTFLNSHLADARRRKLELLRRATSLASNSGD